MSESGGPSQNTGGRELRIFSLSPSCGCSAVKIDHHTIKPGDVATLSVGMKTEHFGLQESAIFLETNDTRHSSIVLPITCKIDPSIHIEPKFVDFGNVNSTDRPQTRRLTLTNVPRTSTGSGAVLECYTGSEYVQAMLLPLENIRDVQILVTLTDRGPIGAFHVPLRIGYSGSGEYIETVVNGTVRGSYFAVPSALDLGVVTRNSEPAVQNVQVFHRDASATVDIESVTIDDTLQHTGLIRALVVKKENYHGVQVVVDSKNYRDVWPTWVFSGVMTIRCKERTSGITTDIAVPLRTAINSKNITL